ncbi:uncharacterized protein EV422DRAFT_518318 [Fimicolochytrium jonesii]|uniref:uncharacterized protein n=1 Tax=Fimicolochytrium jonesii TaxID=1396493 RepID=UPI0022FE46DC|nr:uncharacterized protein EV422DRAFT_518318 [Fimicolochytrium jonesii]KAI8825298.1 hypothetical protein EV422DRAFT_518318 [Fimicolochytrium jonesii]
MKRTLTYRTVTVHWRNVATVAVLLTALLIAIGGGFLTKSLSERTYNTCTHVYKDVTYYDNNLVPGVCIGIIINILGLLWGILVALVLANGENESRLECGCLLGSLEDGKNLVSVVGVMLPTHS